MRGPEDLIQIKVRLTAIVSLDRERIVEDPVWASIADTVDLNDQEQVKQALYSYLGHYISREKKQLFDTIFMPSTNGPADIQIDTMEDIDGTGNNESSGNGVHRDS